MLEHTHQEEKGGYREFVSTVIYINVKYNIYLYVFWVLGFHKLYEVQFFLDVSYMRIWQQKCHVPVARTIKCQRRAFRVSGPMYGRCTGVYI